MDMQRLDRLLTSIDELNLQDPLTVEWEGALRPFAYAYSQWLTDWIMRLDEQPSEALLIAARGQHVQRWQIPRSEFASNRSGYLKWREALKRMHASTVAALMLALAYTEDEIKAVQAIITKRDLKSPDTQTMEDALCLVFLKYQLDDLIEKTEEEKMVTIIRKTWRKMSERGHEQALKIDYSEKAKAILDKALNKA